MKLGITMPSRTAPLSRIPDYARMADEAGFVSVWTYELYRNPFAMLCTSALTTSKAELCTGLATAFNRSPFEAANAATVSTATRKGHSARRADSLTRAMILDSGLCI